MMGHQNLFRRTVKALIKEAIIRRKERGISSVLTSPSKTANTKP